MDGIYFGDIEGFENWISRKYGFNELDKLYQGIENNIELDIVYTPNINEYMGKRSLQVYIQSYR